MARPGLTRHRKFVRLAHELGSVALARGHIELLWDVAYENGDDLIGDAVDVELAAQWTGNPGVLVTALLQVGLIDQLDGGLFRVHDLWHHCPDYVRRRRSREAGRRGKTDPVQSVTGQCPVSDPSMNLKSGLPSCTTPAPAPAPAHSNHPPYPPPSGGGSRRRLRSLTPNQAKAEIDAIRQRHYPGPIPEPDLRRIRDLSALAQTHGTAGASGPP